jgi:hypothetical protein
MPTSFFCSLDRLSENTHKDVPERQSIPEITPASKNRVGNPTWGMNEKIIVAKSNSPQSQSFSPFSELQNDQKKYFCLPGMIKINDQNVGLQKNNFIYKPTYESKMIEKAQTPKILVSQGKKLSEETDVKVRKSDEIPNHITHTAITGWGNPMPTNWDNKRHEMLKEYEINQKKQKEKNLFKWEIQITPKEKLINERIIEALDKYDNFQKRHEFINKLINGKNQNKKEKSKNKEKLLEMTDKLKSVSQTRKVITTINPWTNTKYSKVLNDDHFWLQKKQEAVKIATLDPIYLFSKKQFLLCQLGIPKELKHIPCQSLQINTIPPMKIKDKSSKLTFRVNKLVNTKYNRIFNSNSKIRVALKIQNWEEEIKLSHKKAEVIE